MPMIWPTEAREFQVAMTEEVRYCSPAELVAVANWRTKPGLAMMLPMILIDPILVCLQEGVWFRVLHSPYLVPIRSSAECNQETEEDVDLEVLNGLPDAESLVARNDLASGSGVFGCVLGCFEEVVIVLGDATGNVIVLLLGSIAGRVDSHGNRMGSARGFSRSFN